MSFCATCGCEQAGVNRYCNGCGAEFGGPAAADETVRGPRTGGWAAPWSSYGPPSQPASGTVTRPDADIGLLDSLLTAPDPGWDDWYVRPAASQESPARRPSGWRRRVIIAVGAAVIAVALSGAAAYEVAHGHARRAAPDAAAGGAAARSRTPRLATSAAPPAAANAARPRVELLLQRYFSAINQHDYAAYAALLDAQALRLTPAAAFESGYGSTTDSDERLTGISAADSGGVAAAVTFTSHQEPADSPDHSACDDWSITLYLVPDGAGYLIGLPPSGYQASYTSC